MCTTIGFSYQDGIIFGRTLEVSVKLDHKILYVPKNTKELLQVKDRVFSTKYATIGTGFFNIASLGDGINEMGLMGSSNLFPGYASFAKKAVEGKINLVTSTAFDYLLSRCKDVDEVRQEAEKLILLEKYEEGERQTTSNHFFFMDAKGGKIVLEPKNGRLVPYDNPYGVLTNAPEFHWHETNLKNYLNIRPENIENRDFNGTVVSKFGEGSGAVGLPGDFTPPSRFVRSAFFVANTPKDLERQAAILQGFRILSQADIPTGAVVDLEKGHKDETLYTSIMDTQKKAYFIKCHDNNTIQPFYLEDYQEKSDITFIEIEKEMTL